MNQLNPEKLEKFLSIIQPYKKGEYIYPGTLIRQLNIPMAQAYAILETIKELGFVSINYEVYCFKCNKFTGHVFETISQLPEYIECEECGKELNPLNDSIVVYKVAINE